MRNLYCKLNYYFFGEEEIPLIVAVQYYGFLGLMFILAVVNWGVGKILL